jgi:tellurite resistance protein TerC
VNGVIWSTTLSVLGLVLAGDFLVAWRNRKRQTSLRNAVIWIFFYVALASIFGFLLPTYTHPNRAGEFFSGWLTEYSLSFDNLFVFYLILLKLKVKEELEELALYLGILISIFLRAIFIFTGSAIVNRFSWIFFIFAAILFYTAFTLLKENESDEWEEGKLLKAISRAGASPFTVALIALSLTNLIFAFDSIPAIFGITKSTYIIVTANVFAVMGLRQLYFLIGKFLRKIYYLSQGLSFLLSFIGLKLFISALTSQGWNKIGTYKIPEISTSVTLFMIIFTLALTAGLSALKKRP